MSARVGLRARGGSAPLGRRRADGTFSLIDRGSGLGNMTLRLRIVSDHRRVLGDRSSIVFSVDGGTIGRSADNDWVLPDPLRYVSAHHARVEFRDHRFYLQDVSTNGVFVNDELEPLSRSSPDGSALRNGDVIRLGDYQIVAALEADAEPAPAPADTGASAVPTTIHALQ